MGNILLYYLNQRMFVFLIKSLLAKKQNIYQHLRGVEGVEERGVKNKESQPDFHVFCCLFSIQQPQIWVRVVTDVILSQALIWLRPYATQRYGNHRVSVCFFIFSDDITSTASIHQRLSSCLQEPLGIFRATKSTKNLCRSEWTALSLWKASLYIKITVWCLSLCYCCFTSFLVRMLFN